MFGTTSGNGRYRKLVRAATSDNEVLADAAASQLFALLKGGEITKESACFLITASKPFGIAVANDNELRRGEIDGEGNTFAHMAGAVSKLAARILLKADDSIMYAKNRSGVSVAHVIAVHPTIAEELLHNPSYRCFLNIVDNKGVSVEDEASHTIGIARAYGKRLRRQEKDV